MKQTRWKVTCAYDGTDFLGWQSQQRGLTVQDCLEAHLERILKCFTRIHGSGRTDSGVHARRQVFHLDAYWPYGAQTLKKALQSKLPNSVLIRQVVAARETFHARNSARIKRYTYHIYLGQALPTQVRYCWPVLSPLDIEAMRTAAQSLLGTHDFSNFAALRHDGKKEHPIKNLQRLEIQKRGNRLTFIAQADAFLYKMVRSLVGTLVEVGRGKLTADKPASYLTAPERPPHIVTAPAKGLFLDRVFY